MACPYEHVSIGIQFAFLNSDWKSVCVCVGGFAYSMGVGGCVTAEWQQKRLKSHLRRQ